MGMGFMIMTGCCKSLRINVEVFNAGTVYMVYMSYMPT